MTERCGFWQNGSCGREICLEVCRPAVYHLRQYGDVSQEEMDYYEKHGTLERTTPSGDEALTDERMAAEKAFISKAFDYIRAPIGSRDWTLYWRGWQDRATKGTPAQPEPEEHAALVEIHNWLVCWPIATAEDMAQSFDHMEQVAGRALGFVPEGVSEAEWFGEERATQPAPVDERAAFEALSLLLIEVELSGNGESTDFGWPRAVAAARAALAAAPKPGEKT